MQSRRLLIVGGSVIGVVLLLLFITTLFNKKKAADTVAVCDRFMQYLIANNNTGSYAMLSESAKKSDTQASWTGKSFALYNVYAYGSYTKNGDPKDVTTTGVLGSEDKQPNPKDLPKRVEYSYVVKNSANTSDASCTTVDESGKTYVDGFVSTLRSSQ